MRRYWYLAVAGAIVAALAIPLTASAAGSAVLTVNGSGTAVASGDGLSGTNTTNATFVNSANSNQKVTCTGSTLTAAAVTNPGPVPPSAKATETNSSQAFSGCSISGVFGANGINSITTNASSSCPWNVTVDDSTSPATVTVGAATPGTTCGSTTVISATVSVATIFGNQTCTYNSTSTTISATSAQGSTTLVFTSVSFTKQSGPGTCFTTVLFSVTYTISDTTSPRTGSVQVN